MDIEIEKQSNQRFQYCIGIIILSLLCNLVLAVKLYTKESTIIMVPTIDNEMSVGTNKVSDAYLLYRAEQIVQLLFNTRHENYSYNVSEILKHVSSDVKVKFADQLSAYTEDIKSKHYFYVFHKNAYSIDSKKLTITFSGYLDTYYNNKKMEVIFKQYQLSFINLSGLVFLEGFSDITPQDTGGQHAKASNL